MAKVIRAEDIKQRAVIAIVTVTQCLLVDLSPPYVVASFYLASTHLMTLMTTPNVSAARNARFCEAAVAHAIGVSRRAQLDLAPFVRS